MSSTLQIIGPAAIDLIDGLTLSSLNLLPPGGLALSDGNTSASLSITLTSSIALAASSSGGATIIDGGGALTLSGSLAEINAGLASLTFSPTATGSAILGVTATDGSASATAAIAVDVLPDNPPAFIAPPTSLALASGIATPLGLILADDPASALGQIGASPETLTVTLDATAGILLLDPAAAPGIGITGNATGAITLSATSAQFAALGAAIGAVTLDSATGGVLQYVARQTGGPLPITDTSGSLSYSTTGSLATSQASFTATSGAWQTAAAWSDGQSPALGTGVTIASATITGQGVAQSLILTGTADLEAAIGIAGNATVDTASALRLGAADLDIGGNLILTGASLFVGASATLGAGNVTLGAGAALTDFGTMTIAGLDAIGTALLPGGATLAGPIGIAAGGLIDFAGTLQADSAATSLGITALALATNATLAGAGTLIAGNFSISENIVGPGTVIVLGPSPFEVLAGSVGGGAQFIVDPGASLEFGAVPSLYGVFNPTPITVGNDATISFAPGASNGQDTTTYASTLGEQGGVLVLDNPESFAGTILGFLPGDRIDLSTLTSLSIFNITANSFEVEGAVIGNTASSEIVTLHASLAAGLSPQVETDQAGNQVIGLRAATAALTLNDTAAGSAIIDAVNGVATPIEGLGLIVPGNGSAGLVLTISASHGALSDGGAATSALTLSAASALGLNGELGTLAYTAPATGSGDVLNFTGGTGLAGLSAAIAVDLAPAATLDFTAASGARFDAGSSWSAGIGPAAGNVASFASHAGAPLLVIGPGVASEASIAGGYDFTGEFDLPGTAGTALAIDRGGFALFDADAVVTLGGAAVIGDSSGSGTLGIAGTVYALGNLIAGGNAAAASSLIDITGSLLLGQTLELGAEGNATLDLAGDAGFAAATLGGAAAGLIRTGGTATLSLGTLDLVAGTIALNGAAQAIIDAATIASGLITLSGSAALETPFGIDLAGGTLAIGGQASQTLGGGTITIAAAASLDLAGTLTADSLDQSGQATLTGGAATILGAASLAAGAMLDLAAGTLAAGSLAIATTATIAGNGIIGAIPTGVGLISLVANGVLEASGGTLDLGAALTGNATIATGATLDLAGSESGGTISFAGGAGMLVIDNVAALQDAVAGFAAGDAVDLIGIAPSLVSVSGNIVSIAQPSEEFALDGGTPTIAADGTGGTLLTVGGAMPCFTRGTSLLTPNGYRAVETLRPGDALVTSDGIPRAIRWIGWRTIDLARDPAAHLLRPVVIAPGAFGPGRPRRPLAVSPLHAVLGAGALVPAILLVNNATITRDDTGFAVTYYHVELDRHTIVFAEGLQTETYRDNGNRDRFLEHLGTQGAPMPSCAPLILGGAELRAARAALHRRATALGHKIVHGPVAEAILPSMPRRIAPRRHGQRLIFDLPHPATRLTLRCRTGMASDTDPASEDRRALGLCAGTLRADGRKIANWAGQGWHPRAPGDRGLWSTNCAELTLPRAATSISLELLGSVPRWVRDRADLSI